MHALDPFVVTDDVAGSLGLPPGRAGPDAIAALRGGSRAAAAACAAEPLAVALHRRGLADKAPALRWAGFFTPRSLLDADPVSLASPGISCSDLGEHELSSSWALVPVRPASRSPRRSDLPVRSCPYSSWVQGSGVCSASHGARPPGGPPKARCRRLRQLVASPARFLVGDLGLRRRCVGYVPLPSQSRRTRSARSLRASRQAATVSRSSTSPVQGRSIYGK